MCVRLSQRFTARFGVKFKEGTVDNYAWGFFTRYKMFQEQNNSWEREKKEVNRHKRTRNANLHVLTLHVYEAPLQTISCAASQCVPTTLLTSSLFCTHLARQASPHQSPESAQFPALGTAAAPRSLPAGSLYQGHPADWEVQSLRCTWAPVMCLDLSCAKETQL